MHDDDLKRRLQDELDRSVGAPPRLDYSDALMRGRGKRLGLRLAMTGMMVLTGIAIFAGGLWIGRLVSQESDLSPAPQPSHAPVDPEEPCALLDESAMTEAAGVEIADGAEVQSRPDAEGRTEPICLYAVEPPYTSITVHFETGVTMDEFERRKRRDSRPFDNADELKGVGDAAYIYAGVSLQMLVDDVWAVASVQHFDTVDETRRVLAGLGTYIAEELRGSLQENHEETAVLRFLLDLREGFEGSEDPLTTTGVLELDAENSSACLETALLGVRSAHLHRRDGTTSIDLGIEENNRPEPICTDVPRAPLLDVIEHQIDWYIEFHSTTGETLVSELQPLNGASPERPSTGALNDQLWDGDVSFRLLRVDCSHGPAGDENTDSLRAEGNHCFVSFGVVNEGNVAVTLPADMQFLYAGPGGTRFLPWEEGMREFVLDDPDNAYESPIPPGGGAVDQVVFDAPIDHFPNKLELHAADGSPGVTFHLSGCSFIDYKGKVSGGCYPGRIPVRFGVPYAHSIGTESAPGSPYLQRTCFNGLEWSIRDRDPEDVPEGFLGMGTMTLIAEDLARFQDNSGQVYDLRPTEDNEGDPGLCG